MAENLGMNSSGNLLEGIWPMPTPATASQADGPGIMPKLATKGGESTPPTGGNDGTIPDGDDGADSEH